MLITSCIRKPKACNNRAASEDIIHVVRPNALVPCSVILKLGQRKAWSSSVWDTNI